MTCSQCNQEAFRQCLNHRVGRNIVICGKGFCQQHWWIHHYELGIAYREIEESINR